MSGIVITWQQLLFLALIVIGVYAAELLLFLRRSAGHSQGGGRPDEGPSHDEVRKLKQDVQSLKQELAQLTARLDAKLIAAANEPESPYSQAIKLAQQGLDSNAVASGCGISRGEAELIVALYRASGRS